MINAQRAALRGRHTDRQSGRFERSRARDLADLRPDCGRGHAPYRDSRSSISAFRRRRCRCTITTNSGATVEIIARLRDGESVALVERRRHAGDQRSRLRAGARSGRGRHRRGRRTRGRARRSRRCRSARLPTDRFCFEGFLPARGAARRAAAARRSRTSRARWCSTNRRIACAKRWRIARRSSAPSAARWWCAKSTKLHETTYRGTLGRTSGARAARTPTSARGEIVLLVAGAAPVATQGPPTAMTARSIACSSPCWPNCRSNKRRAWRRKSPRSATTRPTSARCSSNLSCSSNRRYECAANLRMVQLRSRPDSRCVRKHMEESPGSIGHGAR